MEGEAPPHRLLYRPADLQLRLLALSTGRASGGGSRRAAERAGASPHAFCSQDVGPCGGRPPSGLRPHRWPPSGLRPHRRQVVIGGRNKYLINGSNVQNNRVQDFFRSVQLNVNNPHFLIMQGRITKVLNMKPPEVRAY